MKPQAKRETRSTLRKRTPKVSAKKASSAKKLAKTKRKPSTKQATAKAVQKEKRRGSAELTAYFRSYNGGLGDFHMHIFRDLKRFTSAKKVLYPGCHRHITPSLFFQNVVYVDNYAKIKATYSDEKVLDFVKEYKEFPEDPVIKFKSKNFESDIGEKAKSFDLLMSLSAGIVSKPCAKYLKKGGYLFASDAHYDARMAFVDPQFAFIAVYDDEKQIFDTSDGIKSGHFISNKGVSMTAEMVQESIDKPKAKRSFKLQKEALFYLFKKK